MSKKDKHKRGTLYGQFCTVAVYDKKCECATPNNYRENTEKPWGNPFQAHHLAPISCVESVIVGDQDCRGAVEKTQWCINNQENMYAMPIWGHTVKHYCRVRVRFYQQPPGFQNIPQHLNDHDLYNEEVCDRLEIGKDDWEPHDVSAETIKGLLDSVSVQMKEELSYRGSSRSGGTHNAWMKAVQASEKGDESPDWYLPFSMALQPRERSFPIKGESNGIKGWINAISAAMRLK